MHSYLPSASRSSAQKNNHDLLVAYTPVPAHTANNITPAASTPTEASLVAQRLAPAKPHTLVHMTDAWCSQPSGNAEAESVICVTEPREQRLTLDLTYSITSFIGFTGSYVSLAVAVVFNVST
jgi:hypothetical protein